MFFLQQVVNGVAVGGVYSILAIGWTMVWGIVGMINWTHGEVFMLGAYAGYYLLTYAHAPILVALAGASVFSAALAIFIDKVFYRPLRLAKAPRFAILITALGVSTFLKNTTSIILQPEPKAYPKVISLPAVPLLKIAGQTVSINGLQLVILGISLVLMAGLQLFIKRTRLGMSMLAASQDAETIALMGAPVNMLIMITFGFSGLLGGAAGVLVGLLYAIDPMMGWMAGIKGWAAAILGGMGSLTGAMAAGVLLGVIENLTYGFISQGYRDAISFIILIATLLFKPSGIAGFKTDEKV